MDIQKQIAEYIATQPEPKRGEMQELHRIILALMLTCPRKTLPFETGVLS